MATRDAFCNFCGTQYPTPLRYPRTCVSCQQTVWSNPLPVSVVLQPVKHDGGEGLLVVRRSIEPKTGLLALTGGFLEDHETWQLGGAREVKEETGLSIDPHGLRAFWFISTHPLPNRILLFSVATAIDSSQLPPFVATTETSERGLVFGAGGLEPLFAFPLHLEAIARYFQEKGVNSQHRYVAL